MRGSATVTIVPSMIDISCAMQTTASAIQRPRSVDRLSITGMEIILA